MPHDCSIMHALRAAGCDVPSSCEQGVCGMCETRVLDGVVDHRDMLLTDSERARNNLMMVCVSRARTPTLTLDL
ncbi:Phenoxybenzoate dioxygenase subunit beta [compost metagenome]